MEKFTKILDIKIADSERLYLTTNGINYNDADFILNKILSHRNNSNFVELVNSAKHNRSEFEPVLSKEIIHVYVKESDLKVILDKDIKFYLVFNNQKVLKHFLKFKIHSMNQ